MKHTTLLASLVLGTIAQANPWFVAPELSYVHPLDSKATYWGMPATVKYSGGYSYGLNAGRTFGNFKLYTSYDYTSFTAKEIGVQTPYGLQTQGLSDDYNAHTVIACADYRLPVGRKTALLVGAGYGYSFSEVNSPVFEGRTSIERKMGAFKVSLVATYRVTPEAIELKHKTIEQPDQIRYTLTISKNF